MEHSNDVQSSQAHTEDVSKAEGGGGGVSISGMINALSRKAITPDSALAIQRTLGNQFLLKQISKNSKPTIQRLFQTESDWKDKSKNPKIRSSELKAVDKAVKDYEAINNADDHGQRLAALTNIETKIQLWKDSKEDGWQTTQRATAIQGLEVDIDNERREVNRLQREAQVAAQRDAKLAEIIPDNVKNMPDQQQKATTVFNLFMNYFRGKITYSLRTTGSVYGGGGEVACATIANGLRDAFRYVGLEAETKKMDLKRFITKPITGAFIDNAAIGNVKTPNQDYADVKRYLFSEHWITQVNGNQFFDPTSGIALSGIGAPELVDPQYSDLEQSDGGYKKGDNITVTVLLNEPVGTGYLLDDKS